jgi:PiT family inorganic phosphate transporter
MSGGLALTHGANDAQKSIGIVAAVLVAAGETAHLTSPLWAELVCGAALTAGTTLGGWPIIRTIGRRIVRLRPLDALSSQTGSSAVLFGASVIGAPVSTTQVVTSSVVGVAGGRRRWRHVHWPLVRTLILAWLVTIPAAAAIAVLALLPWRWLS